MLTTYLIFNLFLRFKFRGRLIKYIEAVVVRDTHEYLEPGQIGVDLVYAFARQLICSAALVQGMCAARSAARLSLIASCHGNLYAVYVGQDGKITRVTNHTVTEPPIRCVPTVHL